MISTYVVCHHFISYLHQYYRHFDTRQQLHHQTFCNFLNNVKKIISYQCNTYLFILYVSCILQKVWNDYFLFGVNKLYKKLYLDKVNILLIFLYTLPHDKLVSLMSSSLDYKLILILKMLKYYLQ